MKQKEESEFGKGLVVNLVKFSEHFSNDNAENCYHVDYWIKHPDIDLEKYDIHLQRSIEMFQAVYLRTEGDKEHGLSSMIELWANGATDHLYDLQVPKKWKGTELDIKVSQLREFGLRLGHGFTGELHTIDNITKMRKLVEEISLELDRRIGIKAGDWGQY